MCLERVQRALLIGGIAHQFAQGRQVPDDSEFARLVGLEKGRLASNGKTTDTCFHIE